jgi:hypothetical protein
MNGDMTLLPDAGDPGRRWELVLTVPLDGDGDGLAPLPRPVPSGAMGAWTGTQAVLSVPVSARDLQEAAILGLAAAGAWAREPGASAAVRPLPAQAR